MDGGTNSTSDAPMFAASRCTPGSEQNVNCNSTDSSGGSYGHDDATAALKGLCLEAVDCAVRTGHPNLLAAFREPDRAGGKEIRKPLWGRAGG